jgi:hypothetical protein
MRRVRNGERGSISVYTLGAAFVAAALCAFLMNYSHATSRFGAAEADRLRAEYLAEGAIEAAKREIRSVVVLGGTPPASGAATVDGRVATFAIAPTGFQTVEADASGIQTIVRHFQIEGEADYQRAAYRANRIVAADATPLFQFAVYYDNDLEILPGPNMTIRGRVHTNADLYLGSGATLTLDTNYVHAAGSLYRRRKDAPGQSIGTVNIRNWVADPFDPAEPVAYQSMWNKTQLAALGVPSPSGYDSAFTGLDLNGNGSYTDPGDWLPFGPGALELWDPPSGYTGGEGHTVLTGEHGVTGATLPGPESTKMFEPAPGGAGGNYDWNPTIQQYVPVPPGTGAYQKGFYHGQAGLSVLTLPNGSWVAYDGNGVDVTANLSGVVTTKQMYDARQAGGSANKIWVTQIDMAALNASGKFPSNGLLYAARYGEGTGLLAGGIRLANGAELTGPLTVVSEDPLYIWGDYNTLNKKPAAVIGDAVNLLSNAWNDTKVKGTLPAASPTTFNVAMVTGNHDTSVGGYNGGFENLPRFHENWTGKVCAITGSFVNAWLSQYATGTWAYGGDRYTAPNRQWAYDTSFNDISKLPPFTPVSIALRDVVSW